MKRTVVFDESELSLIDIVLRNRLFMLQLEIDDPPPDLTPMRINDLCKERDRLVELLEGHSVFREFREYYDNVLVNISMSQNNE